MLLPRIAEPDEAEAARFGAHTLSYTELAGAAGELVGDLTAVSGPVAVLAERRLETVIALVAALQARVPGVPINPASGQRELAHIVTDSAPRLLLCAADAEVPPALGELPRLTVTAGDSAPAGGLDTEDAAPRSPATPPPAPTGDTAGEASKQAPALIVYTSGTTGAPKGVVLARAAIAATLDALAEAWQWSAADVVVHALPLFHVHGLVLGVLGPLRRGGTVAHTGTFGPETLAATAAGYARDRPVVVFGVPTMYRRLADAAEADPQIAAALATPRLLVSGSAGLPEREHDRIHRLTGQRVIERYGMTETLMSTSVRPGAGHRPGTVGLALPGVELRRVDEDGAVLGRDGRNTDGDGIDQRDTDEPGADERETIGEVQVRGPQLFSEYLGRPEQTAASFTDGWFATGDMATEDPDGALRLVGRKDIDLINSGGYKIGAGEIEAALLEHPQVAETAVTAEADPDLGQRVVAWIVLAGPAGAPEAPANCAGPHDAAESPTDGSPTEGSPTEGELAEHVARLLAEYKRPRRVRFVSELPRNELGKVTKRALAP